MKYFFFILTLLFFGCSIEKRLHQPGFRISGKNLFLKNSSSEKSSDKTSDVPPPSNLKALEHKRKEKNVILDTVKSTINEEEKLYTTDARIAKFENTKKVKQNTSQKSKKLPIQKVNTSISSTDKLKKTEKEKNDKQARTANVLGIISFVIALVMVATILLGYLLSFAGWYVFGFTPLLILLSLLSLIIGLTSNSERYKKKYAIYGLVIPLLIGAALLLVLL